jgi:hypothetical protein
MAPDGFQQESQEELKEISRLKEVDQQLSLLRRKLNEIELLYHVVDSDRIKAQRALAELEDEREKLKQGQLLL